MLLSSQESIPTYPPDCPLNSGRNQLSAEKGWPRHGDRSGSPGQGASVYKGKVYLYTNCHNRVPSRSSTVQLRCLRRFVSAVPLESKPAKD